MRLTRSSPRVAVVIAAALATGAAMAAPAAQAAPAHHDRVSVASVLDTLGARTGGTYLEHGRTIITVTDRATARRVRAAGLTPRLVEHSSTDLRRITTALRRRATIPGTAWAIDPRTNRVMVTADSSVSRRQLATVRRVIHGYGDAVRVTMVNGTLSTRRSGGDPIYGGGYRCSLGFNVHKGSVAYFLTAGHCGKLAHTWYGNAATTNKIGVTQNARFPGNDYALVQITNSRMSHPSRVDLYPGGQLITNADNPQVGEYVRRSGSTSGVHTGTVRAVNATVNYAEGTVTGLIQTNVCAEGGDSGGPLFSGRTALGLTSGGNGDCRTGGTTYFQPVIEALHAYGVHIG